VIKRILPSKQLSVLSMPCIPFQPEVKAVPLDRKHVLYGYPVLLSLGDRFDEVIDFMNLHKKNDLLQEVLIL
jgi:hypothetical protein